MSIPPALLIVCLLKESMRNLEKHCGVKNPSGALVVVVDGQLYIAGEGIDREGLCRLLMEASKHMIEDEKKDRERPN